MHPDLSIILGIDIGVSTSASLKAFMPYYCQPKERELKSYETTDSTRGLFYKFNILKLRGPVKYISNLKKADKGND